MTSEKEDRQIVADKLKFMRRRLRTIDPEFAHFMQSELAMVKFKAQLLQSLRRIDAQNGVSRYGKMD